jgi:hypothetical protein
MPAPHTHAARHLRSRPNTACTSCDPLPLPSCFPALVTRPQVIKGIVEGCRQSDCVLLGGETAEMPGFYSPGEYDLAGFAVGSVKKERVIDGSRIQVGAVAWLRSGGDGLGAGCVGRAPHSVPCCMGGEARPGAQALSPPASTRPPPAPLQAGDVILGLKSSGVHSNGFSLVRKVLEVKAARGQCCKPQGTPCQSAGCCHARPNTPCYPPPGRRCRAPRCTTPRPGAARALG